jgi:hypothetical protein
MAVKVMVATAIANGEIDKLAARRPRDPALPAKPRRRRSSVYDADGNEVFITLLCLKCQKMRPLAQFGLRRMADGAIRNQPWCRTCRSSAGAEPRRRRGSAEIAESLLAVASAEAPAEQPTAGPAPAPGAPQPRGSLASEIAAALAAGLRR